MNSVIPADVDHRCYICQGYGSDCHHIFGGPNRKKSEKYGLKVWLCREHHEGTYGVHGRDGKDLQQYLHEIGQETFERLYGSREEFIKIFGKNYM